MNRIIIYSHGFGVSKDDRGLFTNIASALPDFQSILFDYDIISDNVLTARSLDQKADLLTNKVKQTNEKYPTAQIDLICHSQGCVVAALAKIDRVKSTIFLAPPDNQDPEEMIRKWGARDGAKIDLEGTSSFLRRDGTTTLVPKEYWQSLAGIKPINIYSELARKTQLYIIRATNDEVLGQTNFDSLTDIAEIIDVDSDHDFTGKARQQMMDKIIGILQK